jgi:hypothetical protein
MAKGSLRHEYVIIFLLKKDELVENVYVYTPTVVLKETLRAFSKGKDGRRKRPSVRRGLSITNCK